MPYLGATANREIREHMTDVGQCRMESDKRESLVDKLTLYQTLKDGMDALKEETVKLNKQLQYLGGKLIPEQMETEGVDKVRVPELSRSFYPLVKYSASVLDKDKAFQYLRDHEAESLISETVNSSSLAAYLKDRMLNEGIDPPDDVFNFNPYTITGSSRYTPK